MEFTRQEIIKLRWAMIRVLADEVGECGPYTIEKTPKMFKVTNGNKIQYKKDLSEVISMVEFDRRRNAVKWLAKYGTNVYAR
jgi:hypothetical protein